MHPNNGCILLCSYGCSALIHPGVTLRSPPSLWKNLLEVAHRSLHQSVHLDNAGFRSIIASVLSLTLVVSRKICLRFVLSRVLSCSLPVCSCMTCGVAIRIQAEFLLHARIIFIGSHSLPLSGPRAPSFVWDNTLSRCIAIVCLSLGNATNLSYTTAREINTRISWWDGLFIMIFKQKGMNVPSFR
jgi:hypothetical protein